MNPKHSAAKDRLKGNEHRTRAPIVAHELEGSGLSFIPTEEPEPLPELLQLEAGPFAEDVLPVEELRLDSFTPPDESEPL